MHATPTKPDYAEVGTALVRYAAQHAQFPFFAIGGIDAGNVADVVGRRRASALRSCARSAMPTTRPRSRGRCARAWRPRRRPPRAGKTMPGRQKAKRARKRRRAQPRAADGAAPAPASAPKPASKPSKDDIARERLVPLVQGERPLVVTIAAVITTGMAVSTFVLFALGVEVQNSEARNAGTIVYGASDDLDGGRAVAFALLGGARLPDACSRC